MSKNSLLCTVLGCILVLANRKMWRKALKSIGGVVVWRITKSGGIWWGYMVQCSKMWRKAVDRVEKYCNIVKGHRKLFKVLKCVRGC